MFFTFQTYDEEIEKKLCSISFDIPTLTGALIGHLKSLEFGEENLARVQNLLSDLIAIGFDDVYANYLSHPVRVAASYCSLVGAPDFESVAYGLCHNFRELDRPGLEVIENEYLSEEVRRGLDVLKTDRIREHDAEYLETFYASIQLAPRKTMLLKALDKLDNFLGYSMYDFEDAHWMVVRQYVIPGVMGESPRLARYLEGVIEYVKRDDVKTRYRSRFPGLVG